MSSYYFLIRNGAYTRTDIRGINDHNEREKDYYRNTDIDTTRSHLNIHFKSPTSRYINMLDTMVANGNISLRGLKGDAVLFDEFILDVNSKYFEANGGYEAAMQFYDIAYQFCRQEVGEENILSAVLHADERNKALSEELDYDVWHYHMHVVYLPTVQKEIRYTKRCKDPALVGTVKEIVSQISHSKRWSSAPALDKDGKPTRDENGKTVLVPSYGALQTRFAEFMQAHGYTDIERGIVGKNTKHQSIVEYKLTQDEKRAKAAADKADQLEQRSRQLAEDIATQKESLTDLQDMKEYATEVETCHTLLQQLFTEISNFFARASLFRDRKAEADFFIRLREGFADFFARLRNLFGFELITGMPPAHCQSPQLAIEGEKMALSLQIASAEQRIGTATKGHKGDEYAR